MISANSNAASASVLSVNPSGVTREVTVRAGQSGSVGGGGGGSGGMLNCTLGAVGVVGHLPLPDVGIQICINDVSVDQSATDFIDSQDGDLDPGLDQIKRQWRRSSWCPEEGRKKEEKHEKQKMILAVVGKR